jgi:predicted permease
MDRFALDVRATLRSLRRSPGTTIIAVAALAMGIGFTTTMFSIVRGATRSLPFDEPEELVIVTTTLPRLGVNDAGASAFDYRAWSERQRSFDGLAAFTTTATNLSGDGASAGRHDGALVTAGTFALLGVQAADGRVFDADDERPGAPAVVILGHDLWVRRYEADPEILGRTIRTDGEERVVVGVMREGFAFPIHADLWMPLALPVAPDPEEGSRFTVFGRLRDGAGLGSATTELGAIAAQITRDHPATHADAGIRAYPFAELEMPREFILGLYLMVGAVSFALLIACANVANLLLARAAGRTREVAIRSALGAGRRRVVGMHLVESLVLAMIGGVIGLAFAHIAVRFFALSTSSIIEAFWMHFAIDGRVVLFATLLVGIAAVAAGIAPGFRASSVDPAELLRDASAGSTGMRIGRMSRALVVVQVALACGLLIMTAIFVRSAIGLRATPMPFDAHGVLTAQFGLTPAQQSDPVARGRLIRTMHNDLSAIPGIGPVALVSALPGRGSGRWSFGLDGIEQRADGTLRYANVMLVTPGFLDVHDAILDRGRDFGWQDDLDAAPVALVNRSFVERFSPDRAAIGRRVALAGREFEIVGIVPDLMMHDIEDTNAEGVYVPALQWRQWVGVRLMAKTTVDPPSLIAPVRAAVHALDPDMPIYETLTLHDAIFADKKVLDTFGTLFFLFGLGALFMTVVGLYGVVAFAVTRRTREIGIRMALGARRRDVLHMVVRQGSRQVGLGLAIGLLLALGVSTALSAAIEPIRPASPTTFAAVGLVLVITAFAATIVPARRALRVQPVDALRHD